MEVVVISEAVAPAFMVVGTLLSAYSLLFKYGAGFAVTNPKSFVVVALAPFLFMLVLVALVALFATSGRKTPPAAVHSRAPSMFIGITRRRGLGPLLVLVHGKGRGGPTLARREGLRAEIETRSNR